MSRWPRLLAVAVCICGMWCARAASAATLTVAWNPSPEPGIGYLVYWGTQPGTYTNMLNVGTQTQAAVSGLANGTTYYFVIRAYNSLAMLSDPSTELAAMTVTTPNNRDVNGDANADLLWQHDTTRQTAVWYMGGAQNATIQGSAVISGSLPGWTLAATTDLNADSKIDLIWQHDTTRQVVVWYMTGDQGATMLRWDWIWAAGSPGWRVVSANDFNSDGVPDLVWLHDTTRQTLIWYLGGAQGNEFQSWAWLNSGNINGWTLVGAGDFNRDWSPDLVWQHDLTRRVLVWYMGGQAGRTFLAWRWLSSVDWPGWTVVGSRDWNADGTADLLWQNDSTRQVVVWYMGDPQGATRTGYDWLAAGSLPGWKALAR